MTSPILLLIDDHPLMRVGLRMVLESALPNATIREAGSIREATRETADAPDLVLLDIVLPGLNGLDGLGVIKRHWPDTRVVIVTSHTKVETRDSAIARGADGFMSKSASTDTMVATLQAVLRGESDPGEAISAAVSAAPHLTPRQCEVLDLLSQGLSNKVIGRQLNLSENTVRVHVQHLLATLGVKSRAEAVNVARSRGLVQ